MYMLLVAPVFGEMSSLSSKATSSKAYTLGILIIAT